MVKHYGIAITDTFDISITPEKEAKKCKRYCGDFYSDKNLEEIAAAVQRSFQEMGWEIKFIKAEELKQGEMKEDAYLMLSDTDVQYIYCANVTENLGEWFWHPSIQAGYIGVIGMMVEASACDEKKGELQELVEQERARFE